MNIVVGYLPTPAGRAALRAGITEAMRIVGRANQYIAAQEPWKLAKDPDQAERLATVLWTALQVVSDANTLLTPYLPSSAQQVHETLMALLNSNFAVVTTTDDWQSAVVDGSGLEGSNLVESAMNG